MIIALLITYALAKPSYLTEPQDCYVPDPGLDCSGGCKNQGGSSPCLSAMGYCLEPDTSATLSINDMSVSTTMTLFADFNNDITITVSDLGFPLKYYFASVSSGVVFTENNFGERFCGDSSIRILEEVEGMSADSDSMSGGSDSMSGDSDTMSGDSMSGDSMSGGSDGPVAVDTGSFTLRVNNATELLSFDFSLVYGPDYGQTYGMKISVVKQGTRRADYIVVGAGPGGSFAASELAKSNTGSVMLLEFGVDDSHDDWYGRPGGDSEQWSTAGLWSNSKANQVVIDQYAMASIVGGNQMHNGMHYTRIPFSDFDRWGVKWTEDFWRETYSILESDATMTWREPDSTLVGFTIEENADMGLIPGKVSGMRYTATCASGDCQWGEIWDPAAQARNAANYRIERHTWYNDLIANNDGIEVITFNQETKVESLVLENGKCTGVKLGNGDIIYADKAVVLSGGVFGTAEILLRSPLENAEVGKNLHHHRVMVQETTPSMLALTYACAEMPEYQSYMAPSGNGFFRFRVHCTNEVGWMYMPAITGSIGSVSLDENGNFVVDRTDPIHADDIDSIVADIQEFYSHLSAYTGSLAAATVQDSQALRTLVSNPGSWSITYHFGGTCSAGSCTNRRLRVNGIQNVYVGDNAAAATSFNGHGTGMAGFLGIAAARFLLEDRDRILYYNLHPTATTEAVKIGSLFDNNVVTLPDDSEISLQAGEIYQWSGPKLGDIVGCKKPCDVSGVSRDPEMVYPWGQEMNIGRNFSSYVTRYGPRFVIRAFEDAVVSIHTNRGDLGFWSGSLKAGEVKHITDFDTSATGARQTISSTGDILVMFYGHSSTASVLEADIVMLEPMSTEWIGTPSSSAYIVNPEGGDYRVTCGNGFTDQDSRVHHRIRGDSGFRYAGCSVSSVAPIGVSAYADGGGTDAVYWGRPETMGRVGMITRDVLILKMVSYENTTCVVSGETITFNGDGIYDALLNDVKEGAMIHCEDPVIAFYDPAHTRDEGRVFMYNYDDTSRPTSMPSISPSTSSPTISDPTASPTTPAPTRTPSVSPTKAPTIYVPEIPEYEFMNLYRYDTNAELFIAAALDDTTVTLADGREVKLDAGQIYTGAAKQFDVVSANRPVSVTGLVHNNRFEYVPLQKRAREFYFRNTRGTPQIRLYALEDAEVTMTYRTTHRSKNSLEMTSFTLNAGENRIVSHNQTEADLFMRKTDQLVFHVQSTGDLLAVYWACQDRECENVDLMDYMIGQPGATSVLGSPASYADIMNGELSVVTVECSDGRIFTGNSLYVYIRGNSRWYVPGCKASSTTPLWGVNVADGGGADGVAWISTDDAGMIGVLPVDADIVQLISEEAATCNVGGVAYMLETNTTVSEFTIRDQPNTVAGAVIECDKPTAVFYDPSDRDDEASLPMYRYTDPCEPCRDEILPVCSPTGGGFDNACLALCNGVTDYSLGQCNPTQSPTSSMPTASPTFFPTTTKPTEMPIPLYTTDERMYVLQDLLASTTRHVMLQQVQTEHDLRSRGSSGMTRIRAYSDGEQNFLADGGLVNGAMLTMHNHPDFPQTMGLGEFGAVLNGVRFDTRHNDYKIRKPSAESAVKYNDLEEIEYPEVPPTVLAKGDNVTAQIEEMQMYFKAFKEQDTSIRDYRPFFKPVLCYLEGAWVVDENLNDPFQSDRHTIDHDSWKALHEAQVFRANSGKKHRLENTPFLPTKIVDVRIDELNGISYPIFANFEYRIACQDYDEDIPTERFYIDGPESVIQKYGRGRKDVQPEDLMYTRSAHFKLNSLMPDEWEANKNRGRSMKPRPVTRRSYLDHLMEQIPGKDGPNGDLRDDSFKTPSTDFDDQSVDLNTAFYTRFFSIREPDAMGRQIQMRGYNDRNLFAAMTTHSKVSGNTVCDDGEGSTRGDIECWTQKWSYAVPLEVVYLTPLEKWNPYNLEETVNQPMGADGSEENPFVGWSRGIGFARAPYQFWESELGTDLADTGAGHFAQGAEGQVGYVVSSGTKIITDDIGAGIGPVRLRYPIFPIHEQSSLAFREVTAQGKAIRDEMERENDALKAQVNALQTELDNFMNSIVNLITNSGDYDGLINTIGTLTDGSNSVTTTTSAPADQVGKWTEQTYPIAKLLSGPGVPESHTHEVYCDWNCFVALMDGEEVEVESEDWDGHRHRFTFRLAPGNSALEFISCDSCSIDTHSEIVISRDNSEVFLAGIRR